MAFCITFGTQEFTNNLKGAENIVVRCLNCGNTSARCITRWPWFTVCFIPLIPLATHKYEEVACHVCRFHQDIRDRPEVQGMIANGGQGGPPQGYPQGPNQGWGGPQQGGYYGQGGGGNKPQYH